MTGSAHGNRKRSLPRFPGLPGGGPALPLRRGERFIGRPYLVWKDDPELARSINEMLARLSEVD